MNVVQNVVQDDYFVTIFIISSKTTIWHSNITGNKLLVRKLFSAI